MNRKLLGALIALSACWGCASSRQPNTPTDAGHGTPDAGTNEVPDASSNEPDANSNELRACRSEEMVGADADILVFDVKAGAVLQGNFALTGSVTETGSGSLPSEVADYTSSFEVRTQWFRLESEPPTAAEWLIVGDHRLLGFGVAEGETVRATGRSVWPPSVSVSVSLNLMVDDELAFYYGRANSLAALDLPRDVAVSKAGARCMQEGLCGPFAQFAIELSIDGAAVELDALETAAVGNYDVWHKGSIERIPEGWGCFDGPGNDSTIAIARRRSP